MTSTKPSGGGWLPWAAACSISASGCSSTAGRLGRQQLLGSGVGVELARGDLGQESLEALAAAPRVGALAQSLEHDGAQLLPSAISRSPALLACTPSPHRGFTTTTVVSAAPATSISTCPTPTVSMMIHGLPAASRIRTAWGVASESPPRWPRVAIDRMNTPSS